LIALKIALTRHAVLVADRQAAGSCTTETHSCHRISGST
jgi:hypothetical protein